MNEAVHVHQERVAGSLREPHKLFFFLPLSADKSIDKGSQKRKHLSEVRIGSSYLFLTVLF